MRLSKAVVKADVAERTVVNFEAPKISIGTPEAALDYLRRARQMETEFRMADTLKVQTGISDIEQNSMEEMIELRTIERLKDVQESAYKEAYELGLVEGKQEAFQNASSEIQRRLDVLDNMLKAIGNLKKDLFLQNERQIVQLAFHMASRLAMKEIKEDSSVISNIIKTSLEVSQGVEEVVVQVAPSQLEFLEQLRQQRGREFDFMKRVKLEPVDGIQEGGCVIITNYGEVDARLEERLDKMWKELLENLPKVQDRFSA